MWNCTRARLTGAMLAAFGAVVLVAPAPASAQILLNAAAGAGLANTQLRTDSAAAGMGLSIAMPPAPHLVPWWNALQGGYDRSQSRNGGSLATGLSLWISRAADAAHGHGPVLITEASAGRRLGWGLAGFTSIGAGAGWNFGGRLTYVEWQRRNGFHAASPVEERIVIGIDWIVFG